MASDQLTNASQLLRMMQAMENRINSKLDAIYEMLKSENMSIKSTLKELKDGVKTSARRSKEACQLLEGKVRLWFSVLGHMASTSNAY